MPETLTPQESPKYLLSAFSVDYFLLENFKVLAKAHNLGQDPVEVTFDVKTKVSFFDQLKIIQSSIYVTTSLVKEKKTICKLAEAEISFDFTIENYDFFRDGDKYQYPEQFLKHLNNVAISTSRGLLFAKFSCTSLQGVIMPLIFTDPLAPITTIEPTTQS